MGSKYVNHSRFNNQHNWESVCDHSKTKGIFTLASCQTLILKLEMAISNPQLLTEGDHFQSDPMTQNFLTGVV